MGMQRWGFFFILKANFERFISNSLIRGVIQQRELTLSFQLFLASCLFCREEIVVFLGTIGHMCASFCAIFFSGHNALLLIRRAHTGRRGDTDRQDDSPSDAGPDGSEWGESGSAITGSAAGPFTGGKKDDPGLGRGHLLFASRVIRNRSGLTNKTQVGLAVHSFSSSADRRLRKIFVITWLRHNVQQ